MITEEKKRIIMETMPRLMSIEGKSMKEVYYDGFSDGYGKVAMLEREEDAARSPKA